MSLDLRTGVFWSSDVDITWERQHHMYSTPGPGVRTQTMLRYAYVLSTRARSPNPDNVEICLRIQHPGPESGSRQCWNMPTYSVPGPGVRTQTMMKYAYVFSTRAWSPNSDNIEICLRIQHPGLESGLGQYWNMPTYPAPGPGVRTRTILKSVALKNA